MALDFQIRKEPKKYARYAEPYVFSFNRYNTRIFGSCVEIPATKEDLISLADEINKLLETNQESY